MKVIASARTPTGVSQVTTQDLIAVTPRGHVGGAALDFNRSLRTLHAFQGSTVLSWLSQVFSPIKSNGGRARDLNPTTSHAKRGVLLTLGPCLRAVCMVPVNYFEKHSGGIVTGDT